MTMRALAITLLVAIALGGAAPARADTGNAALDAAIALYDDLEYEKATVALEGALAAPGLSKEQQVAGYRTLALSYLALGRDADALAAFGKLLDVDPTYTLPATESEKALDLFAQAKAARPQPVSIAASADPATPRAGDTVTVTIAVDDPGARVAKVTVFHRARGGGGYSSVGAEAAGPGAWRAIVPGTFVAAPGLDYYVVAFAADGEPLAGAGASDAPLALAVGAVAKGKKKKPIYATWWFWTGTGAIVAGGVVAAILLSGGGGGGSGNDDATVTITVH